MQVKRQQAHTKAFQNAQGSHADLQYRSACGLPYMVKPVSHFQREVRIGYADKRGEYDGSGTSSYPQHVPRPLPGSRRNTNHLQPQLFRRIKIDVIEASAAGRYTLRRAFSALQYRTTTVIVHEDAGLHSRAPF